MVAARATGRNWTFLFYHDIKTPLYASYSTSENKRLLEIQVVQVSDTTTLKIKC